MYEFIVKKKNLDERFWVNLIGPGINIYNLCYSQNRLEGMKDLKRESHHTATVMPSIMFNQLTFQSTEQDSRTSTLKWFRIRRGKLSLHYSQKIFDHLNIHQSYGNIGADQKCGTLHDFACHPCAGAMLIFSVSFQF